MVVISILEKTKHMANNVQAICVSSFYSSICLIHFWEFFLICEKNLVSNRQTHIRMPSLLLCVCVILTNRTTTFRSKILLNQNQRNEVSWYQKKNEFKIFACVQVVAFQHVKLCRCPFIFHFISVLRNKHAVSWKKTTTFTVK